MSKVIAFWVCFSLPLLSLALLDHCLAIHIKCDLVFVSLGRDAKTYKGYFSGCWERTSCRQVAESLEKRVGVKARGTQNKEGMEFLETLFNPKFKNKVLSSICYSCLPGTRSHIFFPGTPWISLSALFSPFPLLSLPLWPLNVKMPLHPETFFFFFFTVILWVALQSHIFK